jgi:hypothetical protein
MNKLLCYSIAAAMLVVHVHCGITDQQAGSGSQTTNNKCVGTIYKKDKSVAEGAVVRLVPSDYNPALHSPEAIETTTTDTKGGYSFDVPKTDFYNIIARQGDLVCMQDSVALLAQGSNPITNDTLDEPGSLIGKVSVKPGSDPRKAIIIFPGTDIYTTPFDSLGNFSVLRLPEGRLAVKIFTTENGYVVFDTSVIIQSGDSTDLTARIPTSYAPEITGFSASYDSSLKYITLRWAPTDTGRVMSFALHRLINGVQDTILVLNKKETSYTDDCIRHMGDTLLYTITCVGTNYKEGYAAASPGIVVCEQTGVFTKTALSNFTYGENFRFYAVSSDGKLVLSDQQSILKVNIDGTVVKEMSGSSLDESNLSSIVSIMPTTDNHFYVNTIIGMDNSANDRTRWAYKIYKLDADFSKISEFTFPDTLMSLTQAQEMRTGVTDAAAVEDDGTVYFQFYGGSADSMTSRIKVYDPSFKFKTELTVPGENCLRKCAKDAIIALSPKYPDAKLTDEASELRTVKIFDHSGNLMSSFDAPDVFKMYPYLIDRGMAPCIDIRVISANRLITVIGSGRYTSDGTGISLQYLVIFDNNGNVISRFAFPGDFNFTIEKTGSLYGISHFFGPTLYTITLP